MPTYAYILDTEKADGEDAGCDYCREGFEIVQSMKDDALSKCPKCDAPIFKQVMLPNFGDSRKIKGPNDREIAAGGFTKYERKGKGYYERTVGNDGPSNIGG